MLAGDDVRIDVRVRRGARLELVETSGTVAYDMRGASASWTVGIEIDSGGSLTWDALPFVVATGARVHRRTDIRLAGDARCTLGEVFVLGRTGEEGGTITTVTHACLDGTVVLVEELTLDPGALADPAILGGTRCLAQTTALGHRLAAPAALQLEAEGSVHRRRAAHVHALARETAR
ncbi:urease accessory protein UreD [Rhodococcus rhodnii]|uniref:urease accessory protein UreD n=1 Tax=Rhodococcus rhodnii TaxID=38312 RepID=UPI00210030E3|nr:urease accessory protein UreD [Rhodococcus rhodnii]